MGEMRYNLQQRIKEVFKKCDDVFLYHHDLWRLFSDSRLATWQSHLPEASNVGQRIESTTHYLQNKANVQGENALGLFIQVLSDRYPVADERHALLLDIRNELELALRQAQPEKSPGLVPEANPLLDPMLMIAEIESIHRCARSVALIQVPRFRNGKLEYTETGTGWLIAPGLILTCWHVVAALSFADESPPAATDLQLQIDHMLLSFDHTETGKGTQYKIIKLEYPLAATSQQDFALLRLEDQVDHPYSRLGCLPLELNTPFTKQTRLTIIQHPLGQPQKVASGYFVDDSPHTAGRILYTTATESGTSGAPVLNHHNWRVVALHNGENREVQMREGTRIKYILSELQYNSLGLHQEIVEAQHALGNALPSTRLTNPLDPYSRPSNITPHASFALMPSTHQETVFSSSDKSIASLPRSDQQYEYAYSSAYECSSTVLCLAFHVTGRYLASGDRTRTITVWNMATRSFEYALQTDSDATSSLVFSSDGNRLASGGNEGTIILWNFLTQKREKTRQVHADWISCLIFGPDGRYLVSGSADGFIKVWEVPYGMAPERLKEPTGILSIALNPYNHLFAISSAGQAVKLWSISRQHIPSFSEPLTAVRSLLFSPDGRYLVAGDEMGSIMICETTTWKVFHSRARHAARIRCLAFHPNSQLLASGGDDRVIQLWDIPSGKNIQTLVKHTDRVESLAFSPDGQYIASGGRDASIILWKRV